MNEIMQPINYEKIDFFIVRFNELMLQKKNKMNNALDRCPILNDFEFQKVNEQANLDGYEISKEEDNYGTITYTIKSKK
jgi:hypothetical protein